MTTFPAIEPDHPATKELRVRESASELGDGLEYVARFGLNFIETTWRLKWNYLSNADRDTIEAFLEARAADGEPFEWTPPDAAAAQQFKVDEWENERDHPLSAGMELVFRRVFEATGGTLEAITCAADALIPDENDLAPVADMWVLQYTGSDAAVNDSVGYCAPDGRPFMASTIEVDSVKYIAVARCYMNGELEWVKLIQHGHPNHPNTTSATQGQFEFFYDTASESLFFSYQPFINGNLRQAIFYRFSASGVVEWAYQMTFHDWAPANFPRAIVKSLYYDTSNNVLLFVGQGGYTFLSGDTENIFYGRLNASTGSLLSCKYVRGSYLNGSITRLPGCKITILPTGAASEYVAFMSGFASVYSGSSAGGAFALVFSAATGAQSAFYNYLSTTAYFDWVIKLEAGGYLAVSENPSNGLISISDDLLTVTSVSSPSAFGLTFVSGVTERADGSIAVSGQSAALALGAPTIGGDFTGGGFADHRTVIIDPALTTVVGTTASKATLFSSWGMHANGSHDPAANRVLGARKAGGSGSSPPQMMLVSHVISLGTPGIYCFALPVFDNTSQCGFRTESTAITTPGPTIANATSPGWTPGDVDWFPISGWTWGSYGTITPTVVGAEVLSGTFEHYEYPELIPEP